MKYGLGALKHPTSLVHNECQSAKDICRYCLHLHNEAIIPVWRYLISPFQGFPRKFNEKSSNGVLKNYTTNKQMTPEYLLPLIWGFYADIFNKNADATHKNFICALKVAGQFK